MTDEKFNINDSAKASLKQELAAVQEHVARLAITITALTTDKIETVERSYEPGRVVKKVTGGGIGIPTQDLETKYNRDEIVDPGDVRTYCFGVDFDVPGSGVAGIPETVQRSFGMERWFKVNRIVVDDDIASNFALTGVFLGSMSLWHPGLKVPAARFAASAPPIPAFDCRSISPGLVVVVNVENTSKVPSTFHMKIVGDELADKVKESAA